MGEGGGAEGIWMTTQRLRCYDYLVVAKWRGRSERKDAMGQRGSLSDGTESKEETETEREETTSLLVDFFFLPTQKNSQGQQWWCWPGRFHSCSLSAEVSAA